MKMRDLDLVLYSELHLDAIALGPGKTQSDGRETVSIIFVSDDSLGGPCMVRADVWPESLVKVDGDWFPNRHQREQMFGPA
jgi:hypothetical protein